MAGFNPKGFCRCGLRLYTLSECRRCFYSKRKRYCFACGAKYHAKGMCNRCYLRLRNWGFTHEKPKRLCVVCGKAHHRLNMCDCCYNQWRQGPKGKRAGVSSSEFIKIWRQRPYKRDLFMKNTYNRKNIIFKKFQKNETKTLSQPQ